MIGDWVSLVVNAIGNLGKWRFAWTGDIEFMLITVYRTQKTSDGIFGNLSIDRSPFRCVTEENLVLSIPAGTYDILFMWSENFQQIMPHVMVPSRTAIEIHWANWPKQLEGCLALGTEVDMAANQVTESKKAWVGFVKAISDQPALKIKYVEDYGV